MADFLYNDPNSTISSRTGDLQFTAPSGSTINFLDDADNTKIVSIDISAVTTSTERVLTFPDSAINFAVDGSGSYATAAEGDLAATAHQAADIGVSVQAFGAVLDDLNTLGAASTDGEILVATGAGAFAYESGATARTSLGLAIGVDVMAYDATMLVDADIGVNVQAYDATIVVDADIGVSVQGYDADTALTDAAATWTATQKFHDDHFNIVDNGDISKILAFEVSAITTTTTRTWTVPDQNIDFTPGTGTYATAAEGDLAATALQNITGENITDLSDVTITTLGDNEVLLSSSGTFINQTLAEAGISATGHTHLLAAGATDVTSTAAEVNLLDLSGLTAGWVLSADTATTASWKAPTGGLADIVDDTTPQLGGQLDVQAQTITTSTVNGDIGFVMNGTGVLSVGAGTYEANVTADDDIPNKKFVDDHNWVEADITDLQAYILDVTGDNFSALADVTITGIGAGEIPKWSGSAWINNTLAEAGISATGHTHTLADVTDVTSTAAEVNLLDLSGLTAGWVLSADTATTASWKAQTAPSLTNPMTTIEDMIVASAGGAPARLPVGSEGEVLTVASGAVAWAAASGGSGSITKYSEEFDATTDWGAASGGLYTITVTAATHGGGTEPLVNVFENVAGAFVSIDVDTISVAANGDVSFKVQETPDNRVAGKVIITSSTAKHSATFDATTSWGAASGGLYTITVTAATHANGTEPIVYMFSGTTTFVALDVDTVSVAANGDVSIKVQETPDTRFAGKYIII